MTYQIPAIFAPLGGGVSGGEQSELEGVRLQSLTSTFSIHWRGKLLTPTVAEFLAQIRQADKPAPLLSPRWRPKTARPGGSV